jgi:uncharacterized RDD family membrane protein YckC
MVNAPRLPRWPDRQEVTVVDVTPPGGFWLRFVASLIDGLVLALVGLAIVGLFVVFVVESDDGFEDKTSSGIAIALLAMIAAFTIVAWLYEALMTSSTRGATLGKQALGLRIIRADGGPLSFGRATARYFLKVVPLANAAGLGCLMAGFTRRKRALHDMLADTRVIRSR